MFKVRLLALAATVMLAFSGLAAAGTVYVVLASDQSLEGVKRQTVVYITNPTGEELPFTAHFMPAFTNGADRPEAFAPARFLVGPYLTQEFRNLAGGGTGMIELTLTDTMAAHARLETSVGAGPVQSEAIPIVGSRAAVPGGKFFVLPGWSRDQTRRTSFGWVNLSHEPNQCAYQFVAAGGAARTPPSTLVLDALSLSYWPDALSVIGVGADPNTRIQAICDGPSYVFAHRTNIVTGVVDLIPLNADATSTLLAPGVQEPCPANGYCFERPGVFHVPSGSRPNLLMNVGVPPNQTYSKVSVSITFQHGGWYNPKPSGWHGVFWLFRNNDWNQTFGYVNLRGPNRNVLTNLVKVGLPRDSQNDTTASVFLTPGDTYRVEYLFDTVSGLVTTQLLTEDGTLLAEMIDGATVGQVDSGSNFQIEIGVPLGPVEVPTYGWQYRDLRVVFQ